MTNSIGTGSLKASSPREMKISSPKNLKAAAPHRLKSRPLSPTSKRRPSLTVDTKDDRESKREGGGSKRIKTPTRLASPNSASYSKLTADTTNKIHAIQLVKSKYGIALPISRPDLVVDTNDDAPAPAGKSPKLSPSLFQKSANKVELLHRPLSPETTECIDHIRQRQISPAAAAALTRLQKAPISPMAKALLSGKSQTDDKTAVRVSNFIDNLHQKRGITATTHGALPPKSPSAARLASKNKYSSILSNARNVIAASPVSKANAAAESKVLSPRSKMMFLHRGAGHHKALDSDSSDSSDDDSSCSSFNSNDIPVSAQKDVGDFIDSLKRKNNPNVKKDAEMLSSLKAKLTEATAKKRAAMSPKAKHGAQEKAKIELSSSEQKETKSAKVTLPQDYASKHNIKKDVNYYAILSQIQKAVQSDNPSLLMGRILADAGKRGLKLALVTEMIKEEKLKTKGFQAQNVDSGALVQEGTPRNSVTKACALAKEQLASMASKEDQMLEKNANAQNKEPTADIDAQNTKKPSLDQDTTSNEQSSEESEAKPPAESEVNTPSSTQEIQVSSNENATPPNQETANSEPIANVTQQSQLVTSGEDTPNYDSALMSEVEERIKQVVHSATPSIEFGKILNDAKKKGLPGKHLIQLYKLEREKVANAAAKAAAMVVEPESVNEVMNSVCSSESEVEGTDASVRDKLSKEVLNAARSSNPSEVLGKILVDAKSQGIPTEWLFELYTKERMHMQIAAAKEQEANHPVTAICSTESEVSEVSEAQIDASSDVATTNAVQQLPNQDVADVADFFSKFALNAESKETNADDNDMKQEIASSASEVTASVSEVSEHEITETNITTSSSAGEVEVTVATFSKDCTVKKNVHFETAYTAEEEKHPVMDHLWKSPLQKQCLSRRKLNRGGKNKPINGVAAAAALSQKRRLRGARRTHLTRSFEERTKEHSGFLDIDFYSLYEATTCHAEDEEIDKAPWEYRDVRQRFLYEKSVDCRNWFGSFQRKQGNDRVSNPVPCPKSLQIPVTKIPESGDWNEDWFTTWKSRRDNPNNLVTFTEADIPSLSMNSSGTSSTSTTMTRSRSYDNSVESSETASRQHKPVLIEIGNIVSVRFGGERVSKVHPDYTSSLRRSRWRKKYMRGEFAFDAEM